MNGYLVLHSFTLLSSRPDTSTIFLDIGLGFHAEFTLDEALEAIDKQTEHYEEWVIN